MINLPPEYDTFTSPENIADRINEAIKWAAEQMAQHDGLRFGQAFYNGLPDDVQAHLYDTDVDPYDDDNLVSDAIVYLTKIYS